MKKNMIVIGIIFFVVVVFFLFCSEYYFGDDTLFHVTNITSFSKIHHGVVNELGYGIHIFYPPLPHFIGNVIYLFTGNINFTMLFLQFICMFLAGITMYFFVLKLFGRVCVSFISSLLYVSMPYFFTDVFARGALNESFLFWLLPIIFSSYLYLEEGNYRKFYFYFVLGFTFCIYTHLVLSVYICFISIIFLLFRGCLKKNFKELLIGSVFILCLTSYFWVLLLEHYFMGDYYIFLVDYVGENAVNVNPFYYFFFPFRYFSGAMNPLRFYIHPVCILGFGSLYVMGWRKSFSNKDKKIILLFLFLVLLCVLFETVSFLWLLVPNLFRSIQFSWRLSLFVSFFVSVVCGYSILAFREKVRKIIIMFVVGILVISNGYYSFSLMKNNRKGNDFSRGCCVYIWQKEYLPSESISHLSYLTSRDQSIRSSGGVIDVLSEGDVLSFKISDVHDGVSLEFPRIYYLGYELKDKSGNSISLKKNENGLLQADIYNDGVYFLCYSGTFFSNASFYVVIFSFGMFLLFLFKKK